jgi:hypothetical protein
MKTVSINTYKFSELSDEVKQKAIKNLCDINVNYDWWDSTYDDAKTIGLLLSGFDLDRNRHAKGHLVDSLPESCRLIKANHGENCETYKTAIAYLSDYDDLVEKYSDGINKDVVAEDNFWEFDKEADELEEEYLKDILEDYACILQREYEYLTSEEAIISTIEANDYDFTIDGKIW